MAETELTTQSRSATIDSIQKFLTNVKKNGDFIYVTRIDQMPAKNITHIHVDFNDIVTESIEGGVLTPGLDKDLAQEPFLILYCFSRAIFFILQERFPEYAKQIERKIGVRIDNFAFDRKIRQVDSSSYGKMLKISGIVTKSMFPETSPNVIVLMCPNMHETLIQRDNDFSSGITIPSKCGHEKCSQRDLRMATEKSEFFDFQILTIQELPEELPAGKPPHPLQIFISRDLVEVARPGDRVSVTGVSYPKMHGDNILMAIRRGFLSFRPQIIANNIEILNADLTETSLSPEDERYLELFAKNDYLKEKLVRSFAPNVKGHEKIKEAVLLMMAAPDQELMLDGSKKRGDLNTFLIGDAGVAKSEMLKFAARIAPRGIYTSGRGSSNAGLTAAVIKDQKTGFYILEAGAFVLADQGLCVIDEFDKLKVEDSSGLHEGMEQQTISVFKGDVKATLNARTAVLAAANPIFGKYDPFKNFYENVKFPLPLLTRFDFIFIVRDIPNREKDSEIAEHLMAPHMGLKAAFTGPLTPVDLTKYLIFIKRKNPYLNKEAAEKAKEFYLKMRSFDLEDAISITPRYLEAIFRASRAHARLLNKNTAEVEDVEAAISLIEYMMETSGTDVKTGRVDFGVLQGFSKEDQTRIRLFIDILTALVGEHNIPVEKKIILEEMVKSGKWDQISEDNTNASNFFKKMISDGVVREAKPGYYTKVV